MVDKLVGDASHWSWQEESALNQDAAGAHDGRFRTCPICGAQVFHAFYLQHLNEHEQAKGDGEGD